MSFWQRANCVLLWIPKSACSCGTDRMTAHCMLMNRPCAPCVTRYERCLDQSTTDL